MKLKVLFIGNSHTYLHYMPQMLLGLAKAEKRGFGLEVDQSIGDGVNLAWHWNSDLTRRKMRAKKWDYVVLQDRSGGPLVELSSFRSHARLLNEEIGRHEAKTLFFMTWAHRDRPETQSILTKSYRNVANELCAVLAPVGLAWARTQNLDADIILHHKDGRHASPVGAYLTACVFYSVLFNTSPEGLPATFLIEGKVRPDQVAGQASFLQKVAWETVSNSEAGMWKVDPGRA
jgi:hypothetical protein